MDIDVYTQPSHTEGLPRALVEAMSLGLPCLGSKVGGIPELLEENCLFTPQSKAEILLKIKQINKEWMLNHAERNFEKSQEYTRDILEERRRVFYKEFLDSIKG
jgi:glycosyltransferase involved in cell wall biosynthesis